MIPRKSLGSHYSLGPRIDLLALNHEGVPGFLRLNGGGANARAGFHFLTGMMTRTLKGEEKKFIEAQCKFIDSAFAHDAAGGNHHPAREIMSLLAKVWALAHRWERQYPSDARNTGKISPKIKKFLAPLSDPQGGKKLISTLLHFDLDRLDGPPNCIPPAPGMLDALVQDFTLHVVLPLCLIEYCEKNSQVPDDVFLSKLNEKKEAVSSPVTCLLKQLEPAVKMLLFKERSIDKIIGLALAGYPNVKFPHRLTPLNEVGEWYSLTTVADTPYAHDGDTYFHMLTTSNEMEHEGILMNHCAHSHVVPCCYGEEHLFSVRKYGKSIPLATVMMKKDPDGQYRIYDCEGPDRPGEEPIPKGAKKRPPMPEATHAAHWFVEQLNEGAIKMNTVVGETTESTKHIPSITRKIGYKITLKNADKAFREYCDNKSRRAVEFNTESNAFDLRSNTTELIVGNHSRIIEEDGKRKSITLGFRRLTAKEWFEVSGLRAQVMPVIFSLL